jgi:nonsense-mediated mRNA decay protein 3
LLKGIPLNFDDKMTIYCPTCNRSSDDTRFVGNFCELCIIAKIKKEIPESVAILHCKLCDRIKEGQTFTPIRNGSLSRAMEIEMKLKSDWRVKARERDDQKIKALFTKMYEGEKVYFEMDIPYKFRNQTCQRCDRVNGGYYEAIVQLRGNRERILNLIAKLTKYIERRGGFISKIEKVDNGMDMYTSDKMMMNEFFHDYELKPERSFRLYGEKKGKRLYRNTYSLRL